ncbi:MAG: hypothetical protein QOE36_2563 [Gaiellaceae bacterium]|nr:hypothetical protein [Gaiellaceae bacterium]
MRLLPASVIHRKVISIPIEQTRTSTPACGLAGCTGTVTVKSVIKIYPKPKQ